MDLLAGETLLGRLVGAAAWSELGLLELRWGEREAKRAKEGDSGRRRRLTMEQKQKLGVERSGYNKCP